MSLISSEAKQNLNEWNAFIDLNYILCFTQQQYLNRCFCYFNNNKPKDNKGIMIKKRKIKNVFLLLSFFFISLMFVGGVLATDCTIDITSPSTGDFLNSETYIDFTSSGLECPFGYNLYYMDGYDCESLNNWQNYAQTIQYRVGRGDLPYLWDISDYGDSNEYCLAVTTDEFRNYPAWDQVGFFTIDNNPPIASFVFSPENPNEGELVCFTDMSEGGYAPVVERDWDFGDGETSTEQNPCHTYGDDENYIVTLIVTDAGGLVSEPFSDTVLVSNLPPVADANGPYNGIEGTPILFDASGSYDPGILDILTYEWDWNCDGIYDELVYTDTVEHTYEDDYHACVNLKVTDDEEAFDEDTTDVDVENADPVADANGPYFSMEGQPVLFDACDSYDPGSLDELLYWWDWDYNGVYDESTLVCTIEHTWYGQYNGLVGLKVEDDDGGYGEDNAEVTISDSIPDAEFYCDPTNGLEPLTTYCYDDSFTYYDPIEQWYWEVDCENEEFYTSEETNPSFTILQNGACDVSLTVIDSDGSDDTELKENYLEIFDTFPDADFSADPLFGDEPLEVFFSDLSTAYDSPIILWEWDFECDDVIDSYEQNPVHVYTQGGLYDVCLSVTDNDGSTDTEMKEDYIEVFNTDPVAEFSCDPTNGNEPFTTQCTDLSESYDGVVTWGWEVICDNDEYYTSNERDPIFTILQETLCDVSLTVYEGDGDNDNEFKDGYLTIEDTGPDAEFYCDPTNGPESLTTYCYDKSYSYDGITSWSWIVDCDNDEYYTSNERDPIFTILQETLCDVSLTVYEDDLSWDTELKPDYISVEDTGPTASFTEEPINPDEGELVQFIDTSTSYDGIVAWEWDFNGDGTPDSYAQNPTYIYMDDGTYEVTLIVYEGDEDSDDVSEEKIVNDLGPTASFTYAPENPNEGELVCFADTSTSYPDEIVARYWDFGDGETSTEQNPCHAFADGPWAYTVSLTITDEDGSVDSTSDDVEVSNVAPEIILPEIPFATANQLYNLDVDAYDPGDDTYTFMLIDGPIGLIINGETGIIEWTPLNSQKGSNDVTVRVTDEDGDFTETTFQIIVYSWNIRLGGGWNMFSIPLVPESTNVEDVLDDVVDNVNVVWGYKYDPEEGENHWFFYDPTFGGNLDEIVPGYGYYIEMREEDLLSGNGEKTYPEPRGNPFVRLTPGYNLIGHYGINFVAETDEVNDITVVENMYPDTLSDIDGNPINPDEAVLVPGEGYWYFLSRNTYGAPYVDYTISVADYDFE